MYEQDPFICEKHSLEEDIIGSFFAQLSSIKCELQTRNT